MEKLRPSADFYNRAEGLASEGGEEKVVMIDGHISRRTARPRACGRKKGAEDQRGRLIGATKGGLKHQAACRHGCQGAASEVLHDRRQVSDYTGAAALLGSLPAAEWMIADRGYDADWFEMR